MFTFKGGVGIVIHSNVCVLVKGDGGRIGWTVERGTLPTDAIPLDENTRFRMSTGQSMALKGAKAAIG